MLTDKNWVLTFNASDSLKEISRHGLNGGITLVTLGNTLRGGSPGSHLCGAPVGKVGLLEGVE